jgi:hypothetical protein
MIRPIGSGEITLDGIPVRFDPSLPDDEFHLISGKQRLTVKVKGPDEL